MENDLAPIVLFVYNRPRHTQRLLESLRANPLSRESILYVFADGPRASASPAEKKQIQIVRNLIQAIDWVKEIHIQEAKDNLGLYQNLLAGIDQVLRKHPKVIVLEDDLELSPSFLAYMNQALYLYQDQSQVMHINAFLPPMKQVPSKAFFSGLALVWGWATWDRAWKVFRSDAQLLLEDLKKEKRWHYFDVGGRGYFPRILNRCLQDPWDTWDIYWTATVCLHKGLCLTPPGSLVRNHGLDGSGHHSHQVHFPPVQFLTANIRLKSVPIQEDLRIRRRIAFFYRYNGISYWDQIRFYKNIIIGKIYPLIPIPLKHTYRHLKKLLAYPKNKGKASPIHEHLTH